jgi:hypothetical protein
VRRPLALRKLRRSRKSIKPAGHKPLRLHFAAALGGAPFASKTRKVRPREHDTEPLDQQDGISGTFCRSLRSRIWNLRCDLQIWVRGRREKCCAVMKATRSTPCRRSGSGRKEKQVMRRRFQCDPKWITVRYSARCAEPDCQTEINSGERAFYYPSDNALYGTRCGHREKGRTRLSAHRIDENGF